MMHGTYNVTLTHCNMMNGTYNVTLTHCNMMNGTYNVTLTHCNMMHGTYTQRQSKYGMQYLNHFLLDITCFLRFV